MSQDIFDGFEMIDLTLPIYNGAPIWSGEPQCIVHEWFKKGRNHGKLEPSNMKYFCITGHQGTHTDAPFHLNSDGLKLDQVPLRRYMGWARCLDFRGKKLGDHFTAADMKEHEVKPGERILLCTGWDRYLKPFDETYFNMDHPHFSEDGIYWLLDNKIELVGLDVPSVDPTLTDHPKIFERVDNFPIVIELLSNLGALVGREFYFMSLPMNLRDGDGSWVRSVAMLPPKK
jgi:arylformamidase